MEVRRKRLDSEVTFEASTDILTNVATSPAILHGGGCGKDDSWGDEEDMLSVAEESCSQGSSTVGGGAQDGAAVPPDGGWGWFVVFGSFMIHIVGEFFNDILKLSFVVVRRMISCYKYLTLKSPMSTHI